MAKSKQNRFTTCINTTGVGQTNDKLSIILFTGAYYQKLKTKGPKTLLDITNSYILLNYHSDILKQCFPNSEIIIVASYEADLIRKKKRSDCRLVENQVLEPYGEVESLRLALNNITTNKALIVMDDIYFNSTSINNITKNKSAILISENGDKNNNEIGVELYNDNIIAFSYNTRHKWMRVAYLHSNELEIVQKFCNDINNKQLFVFEALEQIIKDNGIITKYLADKKVKFI